MDARVHQPADDSRTGTGCALAASVAWAASLLMPIEKEGRALSLSNYHRSYAETVQPSVTASKAGGTENSSGISVKN